MIELVAISLIFLLIFTAFWGTLGSSCDLGDMAIIEKNEDRRVAKYPKKYRREIGKCRYLIPRPIEELDTDQSPHPRMKVLMGIQRMLK